jgi:GAF domain-containing protein
LALLLIGGGILIARRITRPIQTLHAAVEGIIRGDFPPTVDPAGSDEIGRFAVAINDMLHIIKSREHQLTRYAAEMGALGDICRMVALDKNFDQVVERVQGILVENKSLRMDAVATSLYIYQPAEGILFKRAHAGFLRAASELELSAVPEEHLSQLMDRKQPVSLPELRQQDSIMKTLSLLYETTALASLYLYPIVSRSGVLGILLIASVNPLAVTSDEKNILRIICDQISQGLENEKLFKDMFERHWEMYWLHEAAVAVSTQRDFRLLIGAMAKIMMASCKAEKILYVPSERVRQDLGVSPPGEAYGFYGDSGIIVEHEVVELFYAYAREHIAPAGQYEALDFDDPVLKDAVTWKQFRKHVSSGIVVPIRLPEGGLTIGTYFIFSERPAAFTKERLIKLLLTYVKYISEAYPTLVRLKERER